MQLNNKHSNKLADAAWRDMESVVQSGNLKEFQRLCFLVENKPSCFQLDGWGALGYAVFHGQVEMAKWWMEEYPSTKKSWSSDGLIRQAITGRCCPSMLFLLYQKGCPLGGSDDQGKTLLHHAAWLGDRSAAVFLLQQGLCPNKKDHAGWTALRWAIRGDHMSVVEVLLCFNSDPHATCRLGIEDAAFAQVCGHEDMAERFRHAVQHSSLSRKLEGFECQLPIARRL